MRRRPITKVTRRSLSDTDDRRQIDVEAITDSPWLLHEILVASRVVLQLPGGFVGPYEQLLALFGALVPL